MSAKPTTPRPNRPYGEALDPLREVGLNKLAIQATLAGGLDAQALGVLAANLALGGTLVVITPWLAPVVVLGVSALVAIAAVITTPETTVPRCAVSYRTPRCCSRPRQAALTKRCAG
jgi:hypothetical protein